MGYHALLKEMFDAREAPYDDINEADWLCLDCLEGFIKHYLCAWWLDWKRADGQVIERDCWYGKPFLSFSYRNVMSDTDLSIGWNCRTMTHKSAHASKLNVSNFIQFIAKRDQLSDKELFACSICVCLPVVIRLDGYQQAIVSIYQCHGPSIKSITDNSLCFLAFVGLSR